MKIDGQLTWSWASLPGISYRALAVRWPWLTSLRLADGLLDGLREAQEPGR